jgi:hypothetical protein
MTMRFAALGLALGLLFQGCTIQKRSHLPGWHVERATAMSSKVSEVSAESQESEAVVDVKAEPTEKALEVAVVPAPLTYLEAFVPEDIGAAAPKLQKLVFRSSSCESSHVNHVVSEEDVETTPQNPGGLGRVVWRVLLGVIAAALGAFGIRFVQMGLGWWDLMSGNTQYNPDGDVTLFLLGVILLEVAWRALLAAFPKLRAWVPSWSVLKPDRQARQAKQKEREDHLPPPEESRSTAGRILMGLLAIPLAIGSMPAFAMAFGWGFHEFTVPFALLAMGLVWLSLRALQEAFPKLRAKIKAWASPNAKQKRSAKRQEREATSPDSSQPWWRLSLPVLAIAAAYFIVAALSGIIG